ncbi:MAG: M28 family peptidase [Armatimonadota bacterium]|nr:M28 family peptidase [Armatimonadota bacterium]
MLVLRCRLMQTGPGRLPPRWPAGENVPPAALPRPDLLWVFTGALALLLTGGAGCQSAGRTAAPTVAAPAAAFDGQRAMEWLKRQVDAGPRVPGTAAHSTVRQLLLQGLGPGAKVQEFTHRTRRGSVPMANLIATYGPQSGDRVLLCAHWDTRPIADRDPNPANRAKPIPGANDGASGVAVLMELARIFQAAPPPVGVTIVLFDGEDWGTSLEEMFLGSTYFAENQVGGPFRYAILLDMVGDADLQIYRERHSERQAKEVVDKVWRAAAELGYDHFRPTLGEEIWDDHIPLQRKGIPAIDVIDFDYPYWHTLQDTVDKCSARSLQIVGDVIRKVVYSESP